MVLFLIWLALFLLAVMVLTNVLLAVAFNQAIQGWLAPMSQREFKRTVATWSVLAFVLVVAWVIGMSWPPTAGNVIDFLTSFASPIQMLPWILPAAVWSVPFVAFWKESKRRRQVPAQTGSSRPENQA